MTLYTIPTILAAINGQLLNPMIDKNAMISHLLFDSRKVSVPTQSLFFALKSQRNDGHHYIEMLYQKGVRNFVVQSEITVEDYPNANFIQVENTLAALQQLTQFHREQFDLPVIGITGSNGKTIVKEWLFQLLSQMGETQIVRSPKSYNSQIGVPLSVWQIDTQHTIGIFEAGISKVGEMSALANIIQCEIGILTNIGTAHDEGFSNTIEKIEEKIKLFKNAKIVICNGDNETISNNFKKANQSTFTWGFSTDNQLIIQKIIKQKDTIIQGVFDNKNIEITIPFNDEAAIENAIHCWATLLYLKYDTAQFQAYFKQLQPIALRLALHAAIHNCALINDSYSLDIHSLTMALDFLKQQNTHAKLTLILSDILESGQANEVLYKTVGQLLIQKKIDRLIGIGATISIIQSYLPSNISTTFYKNTHDFIQQFKPTHFQNESILLKGARRYEFEKIASLLENKAHKTVLEVNLNALTSNLNVYKNLLQPNTKMMVMVKASAYGSGSGEVAKLLEYQGVHYLAVAYVDEGVELRKAGIRLPIMVLNPEASSFDTMIRHQLEPEIYNLSVLYSFIQVLPTYDLKTAYPIHIKVDTGMRRLGFEERDLVQLIQVLKETNSLKVASIFSHLVGSDSAEHDAFSHQQVKTYLTLYQILKEGLGYQPIRHICNSSGISRFPSYHFDMVRLGIGLYGLDSNPQIQSSLEVVSSLKATISQIKNLAINETVGYNRSGKATQPTRTATISIGYADGFPRALSNGVGSVWLHGQEAFVMGNVCMDMCMVDVTDITAAQEGDEVVIFNKEFPIQKLAKRLNTIAYEVFTNISERVKRVYFQE